MLCLVLLAAWPSAPAQDLSYLRHSSWSTENGLPQDSVHAVLQTSDGYLWIATEAGIARFDGVSFQPFDHATEPAFVSNDTCCLAEDSARSLWIGTGDGLLRLREGSFRRFSRKDGLPSDTVVRLQSAADGGVLVETSAGSVEMRGDHITPAEPAVAPLAVQSRWTMSAGAVTFSSTNGKRTWKTPGDLPGSRVLSLLVDRAGGAWVGTNGGLAVIRNGDAKAESVPELAGNSVLQTYADREGNYWVGTETTGLHLLREQAFRTEPGLASQALTAVAEGSDGTVWVGTRNDGLLRVRDGRVEQPARAAALTSPVVLSLAPGANGDMWAGTPDGLNRVGREGLVEQFTSATTLPDDDVRALATGRDGTVWVGTRRGLARMRGSETKVFTHADGLGSDLIGALLTAGNGDLWAGTSGGLSRVTLHGEVRNYGVAEGLSSPLLSALAQSSNGALWIATGDGRLSRLQDNRITQLPLAGLPAESIAGLLADREGYLWVRGPRNVQRVAIAGLDACLRDAGRCDLRIRSYTSADGMPSSEFVAGGSPQMAQGSNGEVWIATRKGAAIAEGGPPASPQPFPVVIERMLIDGSPLSLQRGDLRIAPGIHRFDFEDAGQNLAAPFQVQYRYQLAGFDHGWTDAEARRVATYTNLPPGSYTFRVEARGSDGAWTGSGAQVSFRVLTPFYRRWWFLLLALLLLAGAAVSLYRLRLRTLRRRFDAVLGERNRMAREIHDTLAQDFVGVAMQLDLVSQSLAAGRAQAAVQQVASTRKLVMDGLAEARRRIWDLRAQTSADSLPARLKALADRFSGPTLAVRLQMGGVYRRLDARVEETFLAVAQEALRNVQRHSGASEAGVQLRFQTDMLVMLVTDAGRGFVMGERSVTEGHYGVRGMQERAAAIGAALLVDSAAGRGTTVTLRAKIAEEEKGRPE